MANYIKSNSCLLAFDNSPAFTTGERLGLFFAQLLQDVEFSISPARTQTKQIGSQEFAVDSVNFSPDVITNLSYVSRQDFETDRMMGMLFRPSGEYSPVFSGARDFSFNTYLFFSEQQSSDLLHQIINENSFSGVQVIGMGNCYLNNASLSFRANQLPKTSCSFIASSISSEILSGNYMTVPAINLESGNNNGAAEIFLDPAQVSRIQTGNVSGILRTWEATFQPSFENLQVPSQNLTNAVINGMEISLSIDRENSYGFGSDYVYGRDIKYPIQGGISINGIVNQYNSGSFDALMRDEQKYTIEIFNRDPQDVYLSGLSDSQITGVVDVNHLTKNRWLKFDNCSLREKNDAVTINGLVEFSNQFDVSVTENRGMSFKQGEKTSLDDVFLHSSDWHKVVSRDGYSPKHSPFLQFYGDDCSILNLLSSDRLILMTRDNFVEAGTNPSCSLGWTPADIADLAAFFWFSPSAGSCFSDFAGTVAAGVGDQIKKVDGLFGATISASENTNPPILRADGMELDAGGVNLLNFSSPFSSGEVTIYWSFIAAAGTIQCFAQHSTENALVGGFSEISLYDNNGNYSNVNIDNYGTIVMGRFNNDGSFGNNRLDGTDQFPIEGAGNYIGFSFNRLGGIGGLGANNNSTDNRYRLLIIVNRSIAFDSEEDLLIRNWILTNDGASL